MIHRSCGEEAETILLIWINEDPYVECGRTNIYCKAITHWMACCTRSEIQIVSKRREVDVHSRICPFKMQELLTFDIAKSIKGFIVIQTSWKCIWTFHYASMWAKSTFDANNQTTEADVVISLLFYKPEPRLLELFYYGATACGTLARIVHVTPNTVISFCVTK